MNSNPASLLRELSHQWLVKQLRVVDPEGDGGAEGLHELLSNSVCYTDKAIKGWHCQQRQKRNGTPNGHDQPELPSTGTIRVCL